MVTKLLALLGYDEASTITRGEMAVFMRRFMPLVPEDEFVRNDDTSVTYKLSSILALVSQPWFAGFEDALDQEARWANEPPGTFAVRFSASYVGFYAIAVKGTKRCDHWRLMVTPRGFEVEEFISFETVGEVVTYYALHPLPDSAGLRLLTPGGTPCMNLTQYLRHLEGTGAPNEASSPHPKMPRRAITTMLVRKPIDDAHMNLGSVPAVSATPYVGGGMMAQASSSVAGVSIAASPPPIGFGPEEGTGSPTGANMPAVAFGSQPTAYGHPQTAHAPGGASSTVAGGASAIAKLEELMEPRGWLPFAQQPSIDWSQVKLKEKLGSGGSGMNVYRATVGGLCCAVKVMEKAQFRPDQIRHFEEEVNMLRLVSECPHIVKYLHHTVTPSEICLYMEYLPASLFDVIKQRRATLKHFSAYTIASVALEIIKGIHYLHSHDPPILMRDIKSANVFVSVGPNDQFVDVKVGDFGVSREISGNDKAQTFIGTPGWMCPSYVLSLHSHHDIST